MDSNINEIVALAHTAQIDLEAAFSSSDHIPAMVISSECQTESLERFLAKPKLFRAKLTTRFIEQFTGYIKGNGAAKVFIDESGVNAEAIFDMGHAGDPEWGHHRANLYMKPEPDFVAVNAANQSKMSQEDMIDFIEDWEENIQFYDANDKEIKTSEAINQFRKVKLKVGGETTTTHGNFAQSRSAMEQVEIDSDGTELPAQMIFKCKPYVGLSHREITCNIRAHSSEKVTLSYRIVGTEKLKQDITDEFCTVIKKQLNKDSTVTIGTMIYQEKR